MTSPPEVTKISSPVYVLDVATGVTCNPGDLLTWNNTAGKLTAADASAVATFASFMAINHGNGDGQNAKIGVVRRCRLTDVDAPYTAEGQQYLSETAKALTETRPTTALAVAQVVGQAITSSVVDIDISPPKEVSVFVSLSTKLGSAAAVTIVDDKSLFGIEMQDGTGNAIAHYAVAVPENAVALKLVWLYHASDEVLDGSDDHKIISYSGAHDEAHDANTDTLTTTDWSTTAADDINRRDVTAAFNGVFAPGAWLTFSIEKEEEGSAGEDSNILGWVFVFEVV